MLAPKRPNRNSASRLSNNLMLPRSRRTTSLEPPAKLADHVPSAPSHLMRQANDQVAHPETQSQQLAGRLSTEGTSQSLYHLDQRVSFAEPKLAADLIQSQNPCRLLPLVAIGLHLWRRSLLHLREHWPAFKFLRNLKHRESNR